MTATLQPSWWQQLTFGVGVIVPTLLVAALLLGWLDRSVLTPRAAGRRWPEGTRWFRPLVELVVDTQRHPVGGDRPALAYLQAVRFGLVAATCVVVPVTAGAVVARPGLGVYLLAVALVVDALLVRAVERPIAPGDAADDDSSFWVRVATAGLVALAAGVAQAQWGTGSLYRIVAAQADRSIAGLSWAGLPTFVAQPLAAVVAVFAVHLSLVAMGGHRAGADGAAGRLLSAIVDQAWVVAAAAWLVCAFAGGGAVPWGIDDDGTRQVVSVAVFATKVTLVTLLLAWARATWPTVRVRTVRSFVLVGGVVGVGSIVLTLVIRASV